MNVKYRSYHTYRESGSSLLGEVPHDWRVARIAHVFVTANAGEVIDKGFWGDGDELLYTCKRTPMKSDYSAFPDRKRTVQNDLLLTRNGTPYVHKPIENSIYSNVVQRITLSKQYSRNYLAYCLGNSALGMRGYGVSIESFNFDNWKSLRFTHPDLYEQTQIAKFLDYETAKIDALIEKQQQLIALLKEKRQAVISHAVTKGLNPDAPMRDSGVEWLGEVPAHWEVSQLKHVVRLQRGHDLPTQDRRSGGFPIVSSAGPIGTHDEFRCDGPAIVTGRYGTIGEFYYAGAAFWPLNTALYSIDCHGNHVRFLLYLLRNMKHLFVLNSLKAAVPGVDRNDVHRERIVAPSNTAEQRQISEYLDSKMAYFDQVRVQAVAAIHLLKERRTALISAAVTGKIDVRGWTPPTFLEEAEVA